MKEKQNSLSNRSLKLNDISIIKFFTPKLPSIKKFLPDINKTPLNDKTETNNTSKIFQKKK